MLALSNEVNDTEAVAVALIGIECDTDTVADDDLDRDGDPDVEKEPAIERVVRTETDDEKHALCEGERDGLLDCAADLLALRLAEAEGVTDRVGPALVAERRPVVDAVAHHVATALTEAETVREFVAVKVTDVDRDGVMVAVTLMDTVAVELTERESDAEAVTDADDRADELTLTHALTTSDPEPLIEPDAVWHALCDPEKDAECDDECVVDGVRDIPDADDRAVREGDGDGDGGFGSERDAEGLPVAHRDADGDADTETLGDEGGEVVAEGVDLALNDASDE